MGQVGGILENLVDRLVRHPQAFAEQAVEKAACQGVVSIHPEVFRTCKRILEQMVSQLSLLSQSKDCVGHQARVHGRVIRSRYSEDLVPAMTLGVDFHAGKSLLTDRAGIQPDQGGGYECQDDGDREFPAGSRPVVILI